VGVFLVQGACRSLTLKQEMSCGLKGAEKGSPLTFQEREEGGVGGPRRGEG